MQSEKRIRRPGMMLLFALASASALHTPVVRLNRARPVVASVAETASIPPAAEQNVEFCTRAAMTKSEDPEAVCESLLGLEKAMREASKNDGGALSRATLDALDGAWRLVFTTGTVDTQSKIGRKINYFPLRATQSFDTKASPMAITNGIFLGDFALLKFFGTFDWLEDRRRLEFDFDAIAVLGFKIDLPKGGAEELGAATGLGAKNNVKRAEQGKKAFFNVTSLLAPRTHPRRMADALLTLTCVFGSRLARTVDQRRCEHRHGARRRRRTRAVAARRGDGGADAGRGVMRERERETARACWRTAVSLSHPAPRMMAMAGDVSPFFRPFAPSDPPLAQSVATADPPLAPALSVAERGPPLRSVALARPSDT